ncbi:MAG: hypothetical protein K6G33_14725 [Ruminococcus sp.]|uniref:hypothetical protein n=1 Tax=Ruminococcus sp. TaxID=41978 RepID=UPI0025DB4669|nr:hypothetical protein [Ruminococcus sp.]MCR5601978.1 hypothetical protein [Ruminococcus sp.]
MTNIQEQEPIYYFDLQLPEYIYTKQQLGKPLKKFFIITEAAQAIIAIELIILTFISRSSFKSLYALLAAYFVISIIGKLILTPYTHKKNYKKIHAANEDQLSYTFYPDRVILKTPTSERELAYNTANYYHENPPVISVFFLFNKNFTIEKSQCTDEQLNFIRNIVPADKQKKHNRKLSLIMGGLAAVSLLLTLFSTKGLFELININKNTYELKYPYTASAAFESSLGNGNISDVVIIRGKYIEFTYTGHSKDEKYYTKPNTMAA